MSIIDQLKNERNAAGAPHLNLEAPEQLSIAIRPDKSISAGMFKSDPLIPGGYKAHPVTIRAMKKDIFTAGEDIDLLAQPFVCLSCHKNLDMQFWHFCPFCEASFPKKSDR